MKSERTRRPARGRPGTIGSVQENAIALEQHQQIQSACDRAAKLIAENDRQLKKARRMLLILETDRKRAAAIGSGRR